MTKAAWIIVVFSLMAGVVIADENAQPSRKELYELQGQCSKKADEFVEKQGYRGYFLDYDSHYNVDQSTCFVYIRLSKLTPNGYVYVYYLYDVNENRQYDKLTFYTDTPEKEIQEFKRRIRPYMTE